MSAELSALADRARRIRRTLDGEVGSARSVASRGKQVQDEIAALRERIDTYDKATGVLTSIGEQRQGAAQSQVEALVTQGLQSIFGTELSFHLIPGIRAKTPVVDFVVRSTLDDGSVIDTDVMDARGGGLSATVGFLLRLVVLLLSRDRQDTVLFLDETFAHVSAEYEPRLAEFLRELVDKTGVQIIIVTHSDAYSDLADTRYRFKLVNGITHVMAV